MKIKSMFRQFTGGVLVLFALALLSPVSGPVYAMTISPLENSAIRTGKIHPTAKLPVKPISFIAWQGNRLVTTAGAFVITNSVKLLDLAGSRYLEQGFKGPAPSVHLTFRNRKLIKVIIK